MKNNDIKKKDIMKKDIAIVVLIISNIFTILFWNNKIEQNKNLSDQLSTLHKNVIIIADNIKKAKLKKEREMNKIN